MKDLSAITTAEKALPWADAPATGRSEHGFDLSDLGLESKPLRAGDERGRPGFLIGADTGLDSFEINRVTAVGLTTGVEYLRNVIVQGVMMPRELRISGTGIPDRAKPTAYLSGFAGMSMIQNMSHIGGTLIVNREEQLRDALRPKWPNALLERSALDVLPLINLAALRAVVDAALSVDGAPEVTRVEGFRSREDPHWFQLLLVVDNAGEPGTHLWRQTLEAAGSVIEAAIKLHPEAADAIACQISFDL